jgi:carbamoyltransferase
MYILGVSCFFHDAAAALLRDGQLVAAVEEERFTRKKHDPEFPFNAIRHVLAAANIGSADLDYVVFFEKPFRKFERILLTALGTYPRGAGVFRSAMTTWLTDKLWVSALIAERVGVPRSKILFSEHHLSHAASAFFCSPFEEAALMTVDGVGEWATASVGHGTGTELQLTREVRFPHSIGLLYSTFTAFLGFEVNEGEYKVMGMAPYGQPRYVDEVRKLVRMAGDGSFRLDLDYFTFHRSASLPYGRRFLELFGEPRPVNAPFFTEASDYPSYFGPRPADFVEQARRNQHYADIAASIQLVTEELVVNMAQALQRETGLTRLCLAGGVALNSVANWRILRDTGFQEIYVQPAAGDAGGALGAALYVYHTVLGKPRSFIMEHGFWGPRHREDEVRAFLDRESIAYERLDDDALLARTAEVLADGAVVGWFHGAAEWGPRALGHRSILADPRRPEMKDVVNTKIKYREPYRPFAPSVLAPAVADFFDAPAVERQYPSRFMLLVVPIKPSRHEAIPAVTHVDGTGRLQIVVRDGNERYYDLIDRFGAATGVPALLNTSFNLRGEPIVNTPSEAYETFRRSQLDVLVLENCVVSKDGCRRR